MWCRRGVSAVFAVALLAKFWRIEQFLLVTEWLARGQPILAKIAASLVLAVEAGVAVGLGLLPRSKLADWFALSALLAFTPALAALWLGEGPGCGCLGLFIEHARLDAILGIARNAGLIGIMVWVIRRSWMPQ